MEHGSNPHFHVHVNVASSYLNSVGLPVAHKSPGLGAIQEALPLKLEHVPAGGLLQLSTTPETGSDQSEHSPSSLQACARK